jgi:hypothetical protein
LRHHDCLDGEFRPVKRLISLRTPKSGMKNRGYWCLAHVACYSMRTYNHSVHGLPPILGLCIKFSLQVVWKPQAIPNWVSSSLQGRESRVTEAAGRRDWMRAYFIFHTKREEAEALYLYPDKSPIFLFVDGLWNRRVRRCSDSVQTHS